MAHLTYETDAGERTLPLGEKFTVGRSDDNDLSLADDGSVSRNHAVIKRAGVQHVLDDLASQNGTFVQREAKRTRVTGSLELVDGDVIEIGGARLVYGAVDEAAPSQTQVIDPDITQVPERTRVGRALPAGVPRPTASEGEGRNAGRMLFLAAVALVGAVLAVVLAIVLASVI